MCETTFEDMKWMRRANWANNPTTPRHGSAEVTEELEEKVPLQRVAKYYNTSLVAISLIPKDF